MTLTFAAMRQGPGVETVYRQQLDHAVCYCSLRAWAAGKFSADGWEVINQQWRGFSDTDYLRHQLHIRNRITGEYWEGDT